MADSIEQDLLVAHGDALVSGDGAYRTRYTSLFGAELAALEPLFELSEQVYRLFHAPIVVRPEFRANLKADLIAQAHQQHYNRRTLRPWQWAAVGAASVTVAGVIAAAAWREVQHRRVSSQ